jgi:hypothetical protein
MDIAASTSSTFSCSIKMGNAISVTFPPVLKSQHTHQGPTFSEKISPSLSGPKASEGQVTTSSEIPDKLQGVVRHEHLTTSTSPAVICIGNLNQSKGNRAAKCLFEPLISTTGMHPSRCGAWQCNARDQQSPPRLAVALLAGARQERVSCRSPIVVS